MRWLQSESPLDWRHASLLLATLFLSPYYWIEFDRAIPMYWSILPFSGIVAVLAIALAAVFFWVPAIAAARQQASLETIFARSLGTIPASALRICAICFLVLWMARLLRVNLWLLPLILRHEVPAPAVGLFNAVLLAFVLVTSFATPKLSKFSNKLGLAILLAALIRVRDGLPLGVWGFTTLNDPWPYFWNGLSRLTCILAPLGLLASNTLGRRLIPDRKQFALTAAMGFALPLFLAAFLTGITIVATARSHYYRPSLQPTVAMALWSDVAASAMPGLLLILIVAAFGTLRFAIRQLPMPYPPPRNRPDGGHSPHARSQSPDSPSLATKSSKPRFMHSQHSCSALRPSSP